MCEREKERNNKNDLCYCVFLCVREISCVFNLKSLFNILYIFIYYIRRIYKQCLIFDLFLLRSTTSNNFIISWKTTILKNKNNILRSRNKNYEVS